MAQQTPGYFNIDPTSDNGHLLSIILNELNEVLRTSRSGIQRPPEAREGTIWLDKLDPDTFYIKMYNGYQDATMAVYNVSEQKFYIPDGAVSIDSLNFYYGGKNLIDNSEFSYNSWALHNTTISVEGLYGNRWYNPNDNQFSEFNSISNSTDLIATGFDNLTTMSISQGIREITDEPLEWDGKNLTISFDIICQDRDILPFVKLSWADQMDGTGETLIDLHQFDSVTASNQYTRVSHTFNMSEVKYNTFIVELGANASFIPNEELNIKAVQLEQGDVSTDFERISLLETQQKCDSMLFYIENMAGSGFANTAGDIDMAYSSVLLPQKMAKNPTLTIKSQAGNPFVGTNVTQSIAPADVVLINDDVQSVQFSPKAISSGAISWRLDDAWIEVNSEYT